MRYIGWLFPALFVLEVVSIVLVSQWLGIWTLALMALQFFGGLFLLRNLGFSNVLVASETLRNNKNGLSVYQLMWPVRFIIAGVLLLSPGFASTSVAAALMLPLKGGPKTGINSEHFQNVHQQAQSRRHNDASGDIIDGDFQEIKPEQPQYPRIER